MNKITVYTKQELIEAKDNGYDEIFVYGELADKLRKANNVQKSAVGIGGLATVLGGASLLAPVTGGLSYFVAAPIAAMTGVEIVSIIAILFFGTALLIALFKDYEIIECNKDGIRLRKYQH